MTQDLDPRVAQTRRAVTDAVVELLLTGGPAEVRHTRVAEVSGVSRATIYRHWPDRTSLIRDAIRTEHEDIELPEPVGDLEADVRAVVHTMGRVMNDHTLLPLMVSMLPRLEADPDLAGIRAELGALQNMPMYPLLVAAQERGELAADLDLDLAAAALFGPAFVLRFVRGIPLTPELLDRHVDQWLRGIGHR